jgi:type I restriction enzyme, R subunit
MPPQTYLEKDFEEHIEAHLLNSGYHACSPSDYDRAQCLFPAEVIEFIRATQPEAFEKLELQYGPETPAKLCYRLSEDIKLKGALEVLRRGIVDRGVKFNLAYFKPASGMNPEHMRLYTGNRFAVVRQLQFSAKNHKSLDMVLFLNGIPIITAELKNSLTGQFVENAVKQYQKDRDPKEPLFQFKRCLVHFAVGNEKVYMTTRLQKAATRFLPFNLDADNPVNPDGHKTAYLWERILQKDSLLDLLNNYLHIQRHTEKRYDKAKGLVERSYDTFIFPRFHQLDVVRKLLAAVTADGVGGKYLIQHSAGSGKSNSIAWLAHQLASLYRAETDTERLFDSIIVVTDRKILDKQLQDTIKQFEQTPGVVKPIDMNSAQLKTALEQGKDIIITTLQKFSVIAGEMEELQGRRFAVIIDEAHSSQSGESSRHLRQTLSVNQLEDAETEDTTDFDLDDAVIKEIKTRGFQPHISYFAFTATPKNTTLELFGHKNDQGKPVAFHIYSMRQAIEEVFILDVLQNYTTFKRYFKLVKTIPEEKEYEKGKAVRLLTAYVDLQPHAIQTKTRIMLDHFLGKPVNAIQGRGRAMVVTRSRLHAVRFYLAFRKLLAEKGLPFKPLVAFSGTVRDPDSGAEHTEASLNALPPRVGIPDALKTPAYRILVVANKFQTGFDEPLLHTMYVDKKLAGVNAVQALSRLNRTMKGKNETVVLDFVNDAESILSAFQPYYQTTFLEEETDPNRLYTLQYELRQFELYTENDIAEFAAVFFNPTEKPEQLQPILDRAVQLWQLREEEEREQFRAVLRRYIRLYGFVSQLVTFEDIDLEQLYAYARHLNRKLPKHEGQLPYEIQDAVDLDSFRIQETYDGSIYLEKKDGPVPAVTTTASPLWPDEKDLLTNIIKALNETYGIELTEDDQLDMENMRAQVVENQELRAVMQQPKTSEANKRKKFEDIMDDIILEFVHTKLDLYQKLTEEQVNKVLKQRWYEMYQQQVAGGGV